MNNNYKDILAVILCILHVINYGLIFITILVTAGLILWSAFEGLTLVRDTVIPPNPFISDEDFYLSSFAFLKRLVHRIVAEVVVALAYAALCLTTYDYSCYLLKYGYIGNDRWIVNTLWVINGEHPFLYYARHRRLRAPTAH